MRINMWLNGTTNKEQERKESIDSKELKRQSCVEI